MTDLYFVDIDVFGSPMDVREYMLSFWRRTSHSGSTSNGRNSTWIGSTDNMWDGESGQPLSFTTVEYAPCENPCLARLNGSARCLVPHVALLEESKLWPDLVFQWQLIDVFDRSEGIYPEYFRFKNGEEEILEYSEACFRPGKPAWAYFRSANPKHAPIHHWEIRLKAFPEKDIIKSIHNGLRDEGIFLLTTPGRALFEFTDATFGHYSAISRRSVDEIIQWFGAQFDVRAQDAGSFAVTLDELRYLSDIGLESRAPAVGKEPTNDQLNSADQLRPFREIIERDITLTQQERIFVAAGLLRYGQNECKRWDICQQRLAMLIDREVAESLWKQYVDDKAPIDYEAISQQLVDVQWSNCLPFGFELEQVLRGYGEYPGTPDRDERFAAVEKAMRSPRWTTSWPAWEIELPS